jgi:hypothetical protein
MLILEVLRLLAILHFWAAINTTCFALLTSFIFAKKVPYHLIFLWLYLFDAHACIAPTIAPILSLAVFF